MCVFDDFVTRVPLRDGTFECTCSYSRRHKSGQPFTWIGTAQERLADAPDVEGPAQELGMLDDLPACLNDGEPWVEYGVVEDRYAELNPEAFEELRQRRLLGKAMAREKLLNVRETAEALGVHENTVRNWAERGLLPAARLPGSGFRRFNPDEVERLRKEMMAHLAPADTGPVIRPRGPRQRRIVHGDLS